ncbi:MAG: InlB B-repeat-containing protein [Kiritimatiellae bacterium]|nr:InlB B-repeat-containing protein [Kiritimatiellia bacterium]
MENSPPQFTDVTNVVIFVEASAPGYYTTTNSAALTILPRDLGEATIAPIPAQQYAGSALRPQVSVLCGGRQLADGVDFDALYAANDAPGTATVTLTGKGNYTGRKQATFRILPARQTLTVKVGKWGRVRVEAGGSTQTVGPNATKIIAVLYGQAVKATAVPDAGFAAAGAASAAYGSFTKNATASFSFVPKLQGVTIRWKFSSAVGRYFAQVAIPAHAGYSEALGGISFIFADRKDAAGTLFAQLWNASKRAPCGALVTDGGVAYRGVGLGASVFAGKGGGTRVVFGVSNATLAKGDRIVPAGERKIGLYVRNRVNPSRGNESAADVGSFTGCLTWTTAGKRYYLPIVQGAANGPVSTTAAAARPSVPTYVIAFNANGGRGTMASQPVSRGAKAQLRACAFTRGGYAFAGWAKSAALAKKGTVAYKNKAAVKNLAASGKSVTLYAVWKRR